MISVSDLTFIWFGDRYLNVSPDLNIVKFSKLFISDM